MAQDKWLKDLRDIADEVHRLRATCGDTKWGFDLELYVRRLADRRQTRLEESAHYRKKRAAMKRG